MVCCVDLAECASHQVMETVSCCLTAFTAPVPVSSSGLNGLSGRNRFTVCSRTKSASHRIFHSPRSARVFRIKCAANSTADDAPRRQDQYVSAEVGLAAQRNAIEHCGDTLTLAKRFAGSVVEAFMEMFPASLTLNAVFIASGPGFNGLVGVCAALILKDKGYAPTVFRVESSDTVGDVDVGDLIQQNGLSFCDFVPRTLDFYYDVVIDSLFGVGFDGEDLRPTYWGIFEVLLNSELPLAAIDMPSGWDVDNGPRMIDVKSGTFLQPELLVSLGVPKAGAKMFAGNFHYIGGRDVLAPGWLESHNIKPPVFRTDSAQCALLSSSALPSRTSNGEKYGRLGQFEATLWNSKHRIKWVSDEEIDNMDGIDLEFD